MNGTGRMPKKIADAISQVWVKFARESDPSQAGLPWPAIIL
jgi:carboxylesterase type B